MDTKILIVEDNFITSDELKDRLYSMGIGNCDTAFSGEEAIKKAADFAPDLILMDINLGQGIDGIETAARIHTQRNVPIVYLTAYDDESTLKRAKITEPYAYIIKPYEERELQIAIEIALYKHEAEQALQDAKNAADAANQAKSQFLANMSHELRTPLNAILGYAQIFLNDEDLPEKHRSGANTIYRSGEHLLSMIDDILDLSKIEARRIEFSPVDLNVPNFLGELVEMVQIRAYRKGLAFITDFASDLPPLVRVDDKRLRQVLLNLLSNAVKFTEKGSVTFTARAQHLSEKSLGTRLHFSITDTGSGIPPDNIESIFDPFHRVGGQHTQIEGTGLGLAISHELAGLMGGGLRVESSPGIGSTFSFEVEVRESSEKEIAATPQPQTIVGFQGDAPTILIVDDVPANRNVVRDMLTPIGFSIIDASGGQEAIEKAIALQPELILMDLVMPEMNGLEAMRQIRRAREDQGLPPNAPVIIGISASAFDETHQQSFTSECDGFLIKPLRLQDLLEKIDTHFPLDWIYKEDRPPCRTQRPHTLVLPPEEELLELLEAAEIGDIMSVRRWVKRFESADPAYQFFIEQIQEMVKGLRLHVLAQYLREHL